MVLVANYFPNSELEEDGHVRRRRRTARPGDHLPAARADEICPPISFPRYRRLYLMSILTFGALEKKSLVAELEEDEQT